MSAPDLPSPESVKNIFERLSENESNTICEYLSDEETMAAIDPVIVMDYRHDTLVAL